MFLFLVLRDRTLHFTICGISGTEIFFFQKTHNFSDEKLLVHYNLETRLKSNPNNAAGWADRKSRLHVVFFTNL